MHTPATHPDPTPLLPATDRLGIFASLVCLVHCAAIPVLALAVPALGAAWVVGEWLGWTGIVTAAAVAVVTLPTGHVVHQRLSPLALAATGVLLLVLGELASEASVLAGAALSLLGSMGIISAYVTNRRFCRDCRICGSEKCRAPVLRHHLDPDRDA
jgi:hypothetical protein